MNRARYTLQRAWILARMRFGGVRWFYSCGRAVLAIAGQPVIVEPELPRQAIIELGSGPPKWGQA